MFNPNSNYYFLSIDAEFSGPSIIENSMINIGCVLYNMNSEIGKFNLSLDLVIDLREGTTWNQECINEFWIKNLEPNKLRQRILNKINILHYKEAMNKFYQFYQNCYKISNGNLFILSDHIDIDATWINYYLNLCGFPSLHLLSNSFVPLIDLHSLYSGFAGILPDEIKIFENKNNLRFKAFNYLLYKYNVKEKPITIYDHRSINDAKWNAESFLIFVRKINK